MTRDEFFALDAAEAAEKLNAFLAEGKSQDEALAEVGVSKADLMKAQIFFVKDKFIARAWGGYTSTKATGNEVGKRLDGWKIRAGPGSPLRRPAGFWSRAGEGARFGSCKRRRVTRRRSLWTTGRL